MSTKVIDKARPSSDWQTAKSNFQQGMAYSVKQEKGVHAFHRMYAEFMRE